MFSPQVEPLADREQQPQSVMWSGTAGYADRAEVERVGPLGAGRAVVRHHRAVGVVVGAPPGQVLPGQREPGGCRVEHAHACRDDLRADAVPADDRDLVLAHSASLSRPMPAAAANRLHVVTGRRLAEQPEHVIGDPAAAGQPFAFQRRRERGRDLGHAEHARPAGQ